jgi:uncharacterized protein with FMN-binding domain
MEPRTRTSPRTQRRVALDLPAETGRPRSARLIPRRGIVSLVGTAIGLVLLLSFKTPAPVTLGNSTPLVAPGSVPLTPTAPVALAPVASGPAGIGQSISSLATTTPSPTSAAGYTGSVTGPVVATPFGNVQIQATFSGGKIVNITTLQTPSDRTRSQMIAQYAVPILQSEALAAQSAQINGVSGATYTSTGYAQSLQGALDQAKA